MWCGNKTRQLRDDTEDALKAELPANADELLELRALNDAPTDAIAGLPKAAARAHRGQQRVSGPQLLALLRSAVSGGQPLQQEFVLERVLMAVHEADDAGVAAGASGVDVRLSSCALAFLSSGPVRERLGAIFELMREEGSDTMPSERLLPLLRVLMATGQVPPEKMVCVEDEGKNMIGVGKNWYQVQPVREFTASEWAEGLLQQYHGGDAQAAADGATAPGFGGGGGGIPLDRFVDMLESKTVCLWGECYQIAERARLQKIRDDAEEYEQNPPWYRRAWLAVSGGGKS